MKQWYEESFENYGIKYDNETFVQGTVGECDFIEKEIEYNKAARILDIGCGTGRHSIELARRGYAVVGIDLSESLLRRAREKASEQKLQIVFQKHDARYLSFVHEFDLVIMICEGAFPLMETDEMNFQILQNAANALMPYVPISKPVTILLRAMGYLINLDKYFSCFFYKNRQVQ
jgi:SAM-dependent methyltransferase